ncbi:hypothetical protein DL767_011213 [Monosporascus sp. MG133]|nr:hypothetical protein DL767_011213 [Monosporascus sp. MG133]
MEPDSAPSELLAVGNINAPVNSERALSKIYPLLKRIAYPIAKLDRSVCVCTWRFTFSVEYGKKGPTVYYSQHKEVTQNSNRLQHMRMYTLVTSPITMPYLFASPVKVPVSADDRVANNILKPLRNDQKLDFTYRMYRELVDPGVDLSVIVFYGPSGREGKTTLAKNLTMLLAGAVMWSSDGLVGHKSKWPSADLVVKMCEKRVLVCDKCEIEDEFSYQHVKRWTSNGPVSSGGRTGFLSQTSIAVSNKIPFYEEAAVSNSIGRRLVIYDMRKDLGSEKPLERSEIANSVMLKFLSLCLACGNVYRSTPTSPAIAMYTMFRKSINGITAGIGYDVTSNREQSTVATAMIAVRCRVKLTILCNVMKAISSEMIMTPTHGMPVHQALEAADGKATC